MMTVGIVATIAMIVKNNAHHNNDSSDRNDFKTMITVI